MTRRCGGVGGRHREARAAPSESAVRCAGRLAGRIESRTRFAVVPRRFLANNARGSYRLWLGFVVPVGELVVSRVSVPQLVALADAMPLHERQIVETVARLSLVSGRQLSNLFIDFSNSSIS